jgi:hypothetical protein
LKRQNPKMVSFKRSLSHNVAARTLNVRQRDGLESQCFLEAYRYSDILEVEFLEKFRNHSLINLTESFSPHTSVLEVGNQIHKKLTAAARFLGSEDTIIICDEAKPFFVLIYPEGNSSSRWARNFNLEKTLIQKIRIKIIAIEDVARDFLVKVRTLYPKSEDGQTVRWCRQEPHGDIDFVSITIDPLEHFYPQFYPWLDDPRQVYVDFLQSNSQVLLISGPPGCGKSFWIRQLICDTKIGTIVCFDPKLLEKDSLFVDFLTSDDDLLVIEDAEILVQSRESGNPMMARFLNISDGLIKMARKKIIFTTNHEEFRNIDEALLRPGRCHKVLKFRALTYAEAQHAAEVAGLDKPREVRDYTIAELFNQNYRPPHIGIRVF